MLNISAQGTPFSERVSAILINELAPHPDLLDLALKSIEDPEWTRYFLLAPSEERLLATGNGLWISERYMLRMTAFDALEFSAKVPYSLEVVKFLVRMRLTLLCHYDAFIHLISDPFADFSNPTDWDSNLLLICARSIYPNFRSYFLKHARNLPPLRMSNEFITNRVYLFSRKTEMSGSSTRFA